MKLEAGAMETLGKVAGGDMRKAITTLQSAVRLRVGSSTALDHHMPLTHLAVYPANRIRTGSTVQEYRELY